MAEFHKWLGGSDVRDGQTSQVTEREVQDLLGSRSWQDQQQLGNNIRTTCIAELTSVRNKARNTNWTMDVGKLGPIIKK